MERREQSVVPLEELIGVYHAKGTFWGELQYGIGKILGLTHCALCDITHGWVREKKTFKACREALAIPCERVHLDEQTDEILALTEGQTPCVVGRVNDRWELVFGREELEAFEGNVLVFQSGLQEKGARGSADPKEV